jgi:hypothetical protein
LNVNAAGIKMNTFHLPLMLSFDTSTNLPLWYACVLNSGTGLLIIDIFSP